MTVLSASRFPPLGTLPLAPGKTGDSTGTRLPAFRAKAADRARAAFMPGTAWPVNGYPPSSIPELLGCPGSDATYLVSTRHQRFAYARLPDPRLTPIPGAFSSIAHHDGLQPTQHEAA